MKIRIRRPKSTVLSPGGRSVFEIRRNLLVSGWCGGYHARCHTISDHHWPRHTSVPSRLLGDTGRGKGQVGGGGGTLRSGAAAEGDGASADALSRGGRKGAAPEQIPGPPGCLPKRTTTVGVDSGK